VKILKKVGVYSRRSRTLVFLAATKDIVAEFRKRNEPSEPTTTAQQQRLLFHGIIDERYNVFDNNPLLTSLATKKLNHENEITTKASNKSQQRHVK